VKVDWLKETLDQKRGRWIARSKDGLAGGQRIQARSSGRKVEGGRKKKEYGISPDATEAEPN
jgi:hypothetical protein